MRLINLISIPIPMRLIINTHGKLEEVYYSSQDRLLLVLKAIKKKHEQSIAANEQLALKLEKMGVI